MSNNFVYNDECMKVNRMAKILKKASLNPHTFILIIGI